MYLFFLYMQILVCVMLTLGNRVIRVMGSKGQIWRGEKTGGEW